MNVNKWFDKTSDYYDEPKDTLITNFDPEKLYIFEMALEDYALERKGVKGLHIGPGTFHYENALHMYQKQDLSDFWKVYDKVDKQMAV